MNPLTVEAAERTIREILQSGHVLVSRHAKEMMRERGYTLGDVLFILEHGAVTKREEGQNRQYRYHVHGDDLEGHKGIVIVAIIRRDKLAIVTVLGGV